MTVRGAEGVDDARTPADPFRDIERAREDAGTVVVDQDSGQVLCGAGLDEDGGPAVTRLEPRDGRGGEAADVDRAIAAPRSGSPDATRRERRAAPHYRAAAASRRLARRRSRPRPRQRCYYRRRS